MTTLQTEFAGVQFKNPIIITSCSLTARFDEMKRLEDAGAGGLITKLISPFPLPNQDGETRFVQHGPGTTIGVSKDPRVMLDDGVELIRRAKEALSIPIVANFVGRSADEDTWVDTALALESAGADMLELDLNCHPEGDLVLDVPPNLALFDALSIGQDPVVTGRVVRAVHDAVNIPIIGKLTLRAPDMVGVGEACKENGADAISAINALRGLPGLDISRGGRPLYPGSESQGLSAICGEALNPIALKYTALLSRKVDLPLISGGGVMTWEQAVERLMLGAGLVGLCTAVYVHGMQAVTNCVDGLVNYLEEYGYTSADEIRGAALEFIVDRELAK